MISVFVSLVVITLALDIDYKISMEESANEAHISPEGLEPQFPPELPSKESTEPLPTTSTNPNCPCTQVLNGTNYCGLCQGVLPQLEKFQRSKTAIQQKMEQLQETLSLFVSEKTNYLKKIVSLAYFSLRSCLFYSLISIFSEIFPRTPR